MRCAWRIVLRAAWSLDLHLSRLALKSILWFVFFLTQDYLKIEGQVFEIEIGLNLIARENQWCSDIKITEADYVVVESQDRFWDYLYQYTMVMWWSRITEDFQSNKSKEFEWSDSAYWSQIMKILLRWFWSDRSLDHNWWRCRTLGLPERYQDPAQQPKVIDFRKLLRTTISTPIQCDQSCKASASSHDCEVRAVQSKKKVRH